MGGFHSLFSIIERAILRSAVYRWVWHLPKVLLVGVFLLACAAWVLSHRRRRPRAALRNVDNPHRKPCPTCGQMAVFVEEKAS